MKIGAHVKTAGGVDKAIDRAEEMDAETIQIFSGAPQAWRRKEYRPEEVEAYRARVAETGIEPAFLHGLSEDNLKAHNYYYVRRKNGRWVQTPICKSNHQWNSGHLALDNNGVLHACIITGEGYFDSDGSMDRHGGGRPGNPPGDSPPAEFSTYSYTAIRRCGSPPTYRPTCNGNAMCWCPTPPTRRRDQRPRSRRGTCPSRRPLR